VDGGVLVNQPVGPALEAIKDRSANGEIRRVLLYVNPDPGDVEATTRAGVGDSPDVMPELSTVLVESLVTLPRTESVAADLSDVTEHNRRVFQQRQTRTALLLGLRVKDSGAPDDASATGPWRVDPIDLVPLARVLYPLWVRQRAYASVAEHLDVLGSLDPTEPRSQARYTWEQFGAALRFARGRVGWLASEFPEIVEESSRRADDPTAPTVLAEAREWRFGLEPLEYMASVLLNLVARAYQLVPCGPPPAPGHAAPSPSWLVRERLGELRAAVHRQRRLLAVLRDVDDDFWLAELHRDPWPDEACLPRAEAIFAGWPVPAVALSSVRSSQPDRRRRLAWAQARALFAEAMHAAPETWDTATLRILDTTDPLDFPTAEAIETPLVVSGNGSATVEADRRVRPAAIAYRRAEMLIAHRLAQLFVDGTDVLYDACDHAIAGWREFVVNAWRDSPFEGADRWNRIVMPGVEEWGGPHLDDAPGIAPAVALAGEVVRLSRKPPTQGELVPEPRRWDELLQELFGLYIVQRMADAGIDDREVRIDFVQVSANTSSPLSGDRPATAKVAGLQLGHFGGFVKESWRANDWMWGILDGASRLVAVLLEPARLKQRYKDADDAADRLTAIARGLDPDVAGGKALFEMSDQDRTFLERTVDAGSIRTELRACWKTLDTASLPVTRFELARTAQLFAARRELVAVGGAIRFSGDNHAAESTDAARFLAELEPYLPPAAERPEQRAARRARRRVQQAVSVPPPRPIPLEKVEDLVRRCPVASERLRGEYGSDKLTAMAAQAAAVAGNLVASKKIGTGVLRRPAALARYGLRGLYYMAGSVIDDTKTDAAFRNLLLAVAGVILGLAVFGVELPQALVVAALVAVAGWVVLTVRSVDGWRGVVPVVPLVVVLLLVAVMMLDDNGIRDLFTDAGDNRWRGSALGVGITIGIVGAAIETIRAVKARRWDHAGHAAGWLIAAGVWIGLWQWLFNGPNAGPRRFAVDRLEDVHRVRIVLLLAIPAALIGFDLIRTHLARNQTRQRRAHATAEVKVRTEGSIVEGGAPDVSSPAAGRPAVPVLH
jgi:Protein of unknown function (DUF3376)